MKDIELLAPAGDLEKLEIAYLYGADAVYCSGKKFGLRANANNFSLDEIKQAVSIAKKKQKKIYVTINIVFHEEELDGLDDYLLFLDKIGVDAVIASDILVIKRIKELNLKMEVHVSTQSSILNASSAEFYKKLGVNRLVLAREASLEDIKDIKEKTSLDLEVFIHGAMCTSFSGRCVLSNYCTNRDSNRGGCAQICRWTFDYKDVDQVFSMTPKDLNLIEYINDLIKVGVNSFKIEGRMRGIYYIATVVLAYRRMIDKIKNNTLTTGECKYYLNVLNRCANRESTAQFVDKLPGVDEQYFLGRQELSNQDFLGIVTDFDDNNNIVTIEQRNYFKIGDIVEFFGPNHNTIDFKVTKIVTIDDEIIEVANHPRMIIKLKVNFKLEKYDMMRKKMFDKQTFL